MAWTVGDHGFEMTLSRKIPDLIARHLRPWLEGWLGDNGLSVEAVGSWAVHPGGPKVLAAVEEGLGLPPDGAGDVVGGVRRLRQHVVADGAVHPRPAAEANAARPCVMLGFGPGLVAEAVLLL